VTPHPYFARKWGLPQGFARQDNSAGIYNKDNRGIVSKRIEQKSEAMLSRLQPPFFFWAHFYDPHAHYMPRRVNRFGDRDVDLYDGEIAETDAWIGKLLRWIGANVKGSTIIAITADHGEEFGEHGGQFHGTTLYEEIVHVPLLIRVPGAMPAAVSTPVRLIDLVPTFLDLLRVPAPPDLSGRSLGSVFAGEPLPSPPPPVFSEASQLAWKVMVLRDHQKLIYDRDHDTWELYDLRVDPDELRNRIGIEPAVAQSLKRLLVPWARSHR
jgi:arylsulfatase A-like enzyme